MEPEEIEKVAIDELGRLCVWPSSLTFEYIYREAMEVHWDRDGAFLYSPKPREWSYSRWFEQIISAAEDQNISLVLTEETEWQNIDVKLHQEILDYMRRRKN